MSDNLLFRYQPDAMTVDILKKLFVGENRKRLLSKLTRDIKKSIINKAAKHYLIIGPRGIGKTHFLSLLCNELNNISSDSITIKLSEEEYSIYRVSDFLIRIIENIDKNFNKNQLFKMNDDDVTELLIDKLNQYNKYFIVCMENINQILGEQMDEYQVKKLRSMIQEENIFFILGSAPLVFPEITKSQEPFFNFFEIIYLNELTKDELKTLIINVSEIENNPEFVTQYEKDEHKIDAVVTLTGGNPRIAILLYNLMTNRNFLDVEKAFFKILDESTPYYQDIFRMLSGEKRKIFDTLILLGKPSTPKEIAEYARLSPSSVYSQIRRLEKDGYVKSYKIGRKSIYEVRERLFRLWRELRSEAYAQKRISILINFLEVWYSPVERRDIILNCIDTNINGLNNEHTEMGYWYVSLPSDYKEEILSTLITSIKDEKFIKNIRNSSIEDSSLMDSIMTKIINSYEQDKYEESLDGLNKLILLFPNEILYTFQGMLYFNLNKDKKSIDSYDKAIEINPKEDRPYKFKGQMYQKQNKFLLAIDNYKKALQLNKDNVELNNMISMMYYNLKDYDEALFHINKYLEMFPDDVDVIFGKATILCALNKYEDALNIMNEIKINNKSNKLYQSMALILIKQDKFEETIIQLNEGLTLYPNDIGLWNIKLFIYINKYDDSNYNMLDFLNNLTNMDLNERNMLLLNGIHNIITNNITQGLKNLTNFEKNFYKEELTLMIYNYLILRESHYQFQEENYKNGRSLFNFSIKSQQKLKNNELINLYDYYIITYLKNICYLKNINLLEELINIITNKKTNTKELLKPFSIALDIVKSNKEEKYYDIQIELRDTVSDIVNILKNKK